VVNNKRFITIRAVALGLSLCALSWAGSARAEDSSSKALGPSLAGAWTGLSSELGFDLRLAVAPHRLDDDEEDEEWGDEEDEKPGPEEALGCGKDTDCKGDRLCRSRECVDPTSASKPSPPSAPEDEGEFSAPEDEWEFSAPAEDLDEPAPSGSPRAGVRGGAGPHAGFRVGAGLVAYYPETLSLGMFAFGFEGNFFARPWLTVDVGLRLWAVSLIEYDDLGDSVRTVRTLPTFLVGATWRGTFHRVIRPYVGLRVGALLYAQTVVEDGDSTQIRPLFAPVLAGDFGLDFVVAPNVGIFVEGRFGVTYAARVQETVNTNWNPTTGLAELWSGALFQF
jgi:hypothetical protein